MKGRKAIRSDRYKGGRRGVARGTDRRRERRYGARLDAHLVLGAAFLDAGADAGEAAPLSLYGRTRDLGAAGIGIVVPLIRFDPRSCSGGLPLRVRVELPWGPVEVEAESVHCRSLGGEGLSEEFLVGARLKGGGEGARALLAAAIPAPAGIIVALAEELS